MKRAAIGIRAHSGWAALVAVAGDVRAPEILERRRVVLVDPEVQGASQPYHFAKNLKLKEAEAYLARGAAISKRLALQAIEEVAEALGERGYKVAGCGVILASGRALPALAETLASHAMIHTAEGEFFRNAFRDACKQLGIQVSGIRERELFERASADLRVPVARLKRYLANAGRSVGPPWTQDQKGATLVGLLVLASGANAPRRRAARG